MQAARESPAIDSAFREGRIWQIVYLKWLGHKKEVLPATPAKVPEELLFSFDWEQLTFGALYLYKL